MADYRLRKPVPVSEFETWLQQSGLAYDDYDEDDTFVYGYELTKDGHCLVVPLNHDPIVEVSSCDCPNDPLMGLFRGRFGQTEVVDDEGS